ncbi:GcrA cell cycle regulator, partial [Paracoccus gahaiensis]
PAPQPAPAAAAPRPEPVAAAAPAPEPVAEASATPEPSTQPAFVPVPRRPIVPAGQPLPPQPSANEISPEALASVREVEKRARKLTLMELTERTCKWPIGDPATDKFWFCGLPSVAGKPYCEAHVGVAFQPMSSRRDRRR